MPQDDITGRAARVQRIRTEEEMREAERDNVLAAMRHARWEIYGAGGAASLLGLKPGALAPRIKRLGLQRPV